MDTVRAKEATGGTLSLSLLDPNPNPSPSPNPNSNPNSNPNQVRANELPAKFRRPRMSDEEMDAVNSC